MQTVQNTKIKKKNIIIDTDPGVDDAIALMYAIKCGELNIQLLSVEAGNSPVENITSNTLHLVELFKEDIPVVQGSKQPLKREAIFPVKAQGKNGLGGYTYNKKKVKQQAVEGEACDVMFETLKKNKTKTTIIAIGPMTNIAKMILKYPECKKLIKEIVFESGTKEKIIGRPYKSFNVGFDPEAAEVVLKSGIKLVMIPMELGHFAYLDHEDIKRFKHTNRIGKIYAKMFTKYRDGHVGDAGAAVHDACAVYYLTYPDTMKTEKAFIEIKYYTQNGENFGYIDIDFNKKPNATICVDLDIDMFKYDVFKALEQCNNL